MIEALVGGLHAATAMIALFALLWAAHRVIRRSVKSQGLPDCSQMRLPDIRPMAYRVRTAGRLTRITPTLALEARQTLTMGIRTGETRPHSSA